MNFANEKFDIILLSGQSNAEGSGVGETKEEYPFDGDVYHMLGQKSYEKVDGKGQWVLNFPVDIRIEETDSRKKDDLAVAFAHEYKKHGLLDEDRKILIVETALGGTGFVSGHWKKGDVAYQRMMYMLDCALNMNSDNRLVALLWHQGENEVKRNSPEMFERQLAEVFENIKKRTDGEALPIVSGDFCNNWKKTCIEQADLISETIKKVTESFGGRFVLTDDLPSNHEDGTREGDNIHFSRNSIHILGRRYFDAYCEITEKKRI